MDQDRGARVGVETGPLRTGAGNRGTEKAITSTTATAITKARKDESAKELLELYEVNVAQALDSLQFQNDLIGHHQIDSGSAHHFTFKADIHQELRLEGIQRWASETRMAA